MLTAATSSNHHHHANADAAPTRISAKNDQMLRRGVVAQIVPTLTSCSARGTSHRELPSSNLPSFSLEASPSPASRSPPVYRTHSSTSRRSTGTGRPSRVVRLTLSRVSPARVPDGGRAGASEAASSRVTRRKDVVGMAFGGNLRSTDESELTMRPPETGMSSSSRVTPVWLDTAPTWGPGTTGGPVVGGSKANTGLAAGVGSARGNDANNVGTAIGVAVCSGVDTLVGVWSRAGVGESVGVAVGTWVAVGSRVAVALGAGKNTGVIVASASASGNGVCPGPTPVPWLEGVWVGVGVCVAVDVGVRVGSLFGPGAGVLVGDGVGVEVPPWGGRRRGPAVPPSGVASVCASLEGVGVGVGVTLRGGCRCVASRRGRRRRCGRRCRGCGWRRGRGQRACRR